jgi:thiol-disulfide isomerase/thioredoxin
MRGCRVLLALAASCLSAAAPSAAPLGSTFQRLSHGRVTRATLPPDVQRVAIYYGASWCGPCRAFVPDLIAAYPRLRARGIELLFVSDDATCAAALDYARVSRMPWLLLPCDPRRRSALRSLGGEALPGIVVVDHGGEKTGTSWRADGSSTPRRALALLLGS